MFFFSIIKNAVLIQFATILIAQQGCQSQTLQLVHNSKSKFEIVIPSAPTAMEQQGADVLQQYISRIADCTIPIVKNSSTAGENKIFIGRNNFLKAKDTSGLGMDGVLIKSSGNNIFLTGGYRKGVLYSVYTFLEEYLGCRSYIAAVEVPKNKSIQLKAPIENKQIPTFLYRMTDFAESRNPDYCNFHKLNCFMEDWGLWVHSFKTLLPKEKYFAAHPEYYALVNNKRIPDQPDLTNPDVLKIVIQNLKTEIQKNPTAKFWSVSQNDNQNFCRCPNCSRIDAQQESHQGSILYFVNAVAREFPDKIITTLAYQYSEKPPKNIKPEDNVMIMLATANEDRRVAIASHPEAMFNQNFIKWSGITSQLFIWDYIVQFGNALSPFPNLNVLQPNIRYFASGKVEYMFEQGIGNIQGEFSQLKSYLISKLMWNKDVNQEATIREFLNGFYGEQSAEYIYQYILLLHKNADKSNARLRSGGYSKEATGTYLSPEKIEVYKQFFQKALNAADPNSVFHKRILKEYLAVLYAEIENDKLFAEQNTLTSKSDRSRAIEKLDYWYKQMKSLDLNYLNEIRTKTDDYYKKTKDKLNGM